MKSGRRRKVNEMSELDDLLAKFDEIDVSEYVEFFESRKIGDDVVVDSRFKADGLRRLCRAFAEGKWQSTRV